jgi:hypothetical protein
MRLISRTAALALCLAFASIPAIAGADKPANPGSNGKQNAAEHGNGKGHSKRCKKPAQSKGWVVSGTYGTTGSFTATMNADGTYAGSVSFTAVRTNHHAAGATGPFSFTNATVTFDSPTATAPAATDNVRLIGKISVAKKGCTSTTAGQVTIRKIVFSAPEAANG